jgi:hypothetical protein
VKGLQLPLDAAIPSYPAFKLSVSGHRFGLALRGVSLRIELLHGRAIGPAFGRLLGDFLDALLGCFWAYFTRLRAYIYGPCAASIGIGGRVGASHVTVGMVDRNV